MTKDNSAQWFNIEVGSLSVAQQAAYGKYKEAQRAAAALREAFESTVTAALQVPKGQRVVFGYRFGKLSAALVADERKAPKQATATLSAFMDAQRAQGRSV